MANPREIAVVVFLCLCGYSLQNPVGGTEAPCCSIPFSHVDKVGCVMVYAKKQKFPDARTSCNTFDAAHVVVEDAEQRTKLKEYLEKAYPWFEAETGFWVGVIAGLWLNGAPVKNKEGDNIIAVGGCASMTRDGEVIERNCNADEFVSICKKIQ